MYTHRIMWDIRHLAFHYLLVLVKWWRYRDRARLGFRLGKQALPRSIIPGDHVHGEATMIA